MQNPMVKKLAWLIGSWTGRNGQGIYPTINSFSYCEQLDVTHPAPNQPVLHLKSLNLKLFTFVLIFWKYENYTRFSAWFENPETKEKKHAHFEYGFLKVKPNSEPLYLTYTSSHNNGVALVEEGVYDEATNSFTLESKSVGRTSVNKPPSVVQVSPNFQYLTFKSIISKIHLL
jgi:hypothetical protein